MLYRFRDISEPANPPEMSIQTVFDGINLDQELAGFSTLSVSGREALAREVDTQRYRSVAALSAITSSVLATRQIVVKYAMDTKSKRDYIEQFEQLNSILQKPSGCLIFTDDPGFFYVGSLHGTAELNGGLYKQVGTLNFTLATPYKRSVDRETWSGRIFRKKTLFPVELEKAEVRVVTSGKRFVIRNLTTAKKIILDVKEPLKAGSLLTFDFLSAKVYSDTDPNLMPGLDLMSDFEDFVIHDSDEVALEGGTGNTISFTYREVRL